MGWRKSKPLPLKIIDLFEFVYFANNSFAEHGYD